LRGKERGLDGGGLLAIGTREEYRMEKERKEGRGLLEERGALITLETNTRCLKSLTSGVSLHKRSKKTCYTFHKEKGSTT